MFCFSVLQETGLTELTHFVTYFPFGLCQQLALQHINKGLSGEITSI